MYTQCPECEVAFRVTADVLKQAAGKVRCGGCGVAFNALAHLSEEMPGNAARENPPGEAGTPPQSISAEQSAALLKTLDQLAGDDIRIEDTGVEWRVIDVDEDEEIADDPVPSMVHEEMRFDDNTPLPDDFDLDIPATPPQPPEPEAEPEPDPRLEESQVDLVFGEPDEWEDLLDDLDEVAAELEVAAPESDDEVEPDIEVVEALPVDSEQSDEAEERDQPNVDEDAADVAAIADDELAAMDMDAQFARQAEVLGLDMTGLQEAIDESELPHADGQDEPVEPEADDVEELVLVDDEDDDEEIDPNETSIEEDLIAAAFEVEAAARANAKESQRPEDVLELDEPEEDVPEEDALEAFVLEENAPEEIVLEGDEPEESEIEIELSAFDADGDADGDEINLEDVAPEELSRAGILDEDDYLEEITEEDEAEVLDEIELEDSPADRALAEAVLDEPAADDISGDEPDETLLEAAELDDEAELPDEDELAADLEMALSGMQEDDAGPEDIVVPEPTEEERTVNMMIDQDLLAIAVEDDDGFTSTIVQKQVDSEADIPAETSAEGDDSESGDDASDDDFPGDDLPDDERADEELSDEELADDDLEADEQLDGDDEDDNLAAAAFTMPDTDDNPLMETIIMEGESVMTEDDQERLEAARAAASESLKKAGFSEEKTKFSFRDWQPPRHSMPAAAIVLFVILVIQVIHQSREALAVSPAFQNSIGSVYRMLGSPVTPAWDVTGWRFEATKGSTGDDDNVLTIYSRVGNNSDQALPYPLVHVELKDRFEEIIGSRVLEPGEYLVDATKPRNLVRPKGTFNAVISIDSPSAAATSFKLNVCYRVSGDRLRCDDKDFR